MFEQTSIQVHRLSALVFHNLGVPTGTSIYARQSIINPKSGLTPQPTLYEAYKIDNYICATQLHTGIVTLVAKSYKWFAASLFTSYLRYVATYVEYMLYENYRVLRISICWLISTIQKMHNLSSIFALSALMICRWSLSLGAHRKPCKL